MPSFPSPQFSFHELKFFFEGRFFRIAGVKWSKKKNKEFIHANEEDPMAIQSGQNTYEGEVTFFQSDFQAILDSLEDKDILSEEFDFIISYKPKGRVAPLVRKVLKHAQFTEFEEGMQQGDTHQKITLPFMFLGIE